MEVGGHCFWFQHSEHSFYFRNKKEMNVVILFISGGYIGDLWGPLHWQAMEGLPCLCYLCCQANWSWEGNGQRQRYGHKNIFTMAGSTSSGVFCVLRYSWSRWFLTHRWSRWSTAWQRSGGGWGSSMLRSLQTYWAAAQLNWVQAVDVGLYNTALCRACAPFKIWWIKAPCFCALTRRMPGVSGRCASRADTSGERGAGAAATCQPSSQHLWGPDHGLDGECGYNCSKVCT